MYFSATILRKGGLATDSAAIWGAAAVALTNAGGAWVGVQLVESSGRRLLVLGSLAVVVCALLLLALSFRIQSSGTASGGAAGALTLVALVVYIAGFSPGMGTCPWVVNSEIFAQEDRSLGASVSSALNWTGNLVISMTFLSICDAINPEGAFLLYAVVGALGFIFMYERLPETKGKSFEEIVAVFDTGQPPARGSRLCGGRRHGTSSTSDATPDTSHERSRPAQCVDMAEWTELSVHAPRS